MELGKGTAVIIMAAGSARRWTDIVPKQLVEIDGEIILYRTLRLLREAGIVHPTLTASPHLLNFVERWKMGAAEVYVPTENFQEIDRFLSCQERWGEQTLFLYGDVYYTKEAISQILHNYAPPVTFYGRRSGNTVKPYGEMFALRADTSDPLFIERLKTIREQEMLGQRRGLGWDVFKAYGSTNFVELDQLVEDFDTVDDVKNYKKSRNIL